MGLMCQSEAIVEEWPTFEMLEKYIREVHRLFPLECMTNARPIQNELKEVSIQTDSPGSQHYQC
jgi:hypothetical protein